jgi:hypothetical protein
MERRWDRSALIRLPLASDDSAEEVSHRRADPRGVGF